MQTQLTIAFRNLLQAKRRTFLLGLAVAIVANLFLFLRVASLSVGERMIESATTLSAGHVNIGGFFKSRRNSSAPILSERQRIRELVTQAVPEAVSVIDRHRGWGRVVSPTSSINASINGLNVEEESRFFHSLRLAPEREYKNGGSDRTTGSFDDLKQPHTVLLFASQAKKLDVVVGDQLTVVTEASGRQANTVDLKIVAIASDLGFMSNWSVFTQRQTVLDLYQLSPDTTGVVMLYLPSPEGSQSALDRIHKLLKEKDFDVMDHDPNPFFQKFQKVAGEDWLGQKLDLTTWSDEISYVLWITKALDLIAFILIGILALIITSGLMNTMWMSVRERTKEIGTMRAVGTGKWFVVQMLVLEAMLLGLFASSLGVLLGAGILTCVNAMGLPITHDGARLFLMSNTLKFNLHSGPMLDTLLLFTVMTGLAALYPALQASRLRPVEALMQGK